MQLKLKLNIQNRKDILKIKIVLDFEIKIHKNINRLLMFRFCYGFGWYYDTWL